MEIVPELSKKHGMSHTRIYSAWLSMRSRCLNSNYTSYKHYGGRGITVCDRWLNSFHNFYFDMGDIPAHGYSLDRIDGNGNYEPGNCRWATARTQALNRRPWGISNCRGVTPCGKKWRASIKFSIGVFETKEEAGIAYNKIQAVLIKMTEK